MANHCASDAPQLVEHINQSVTFTPYDTKWVPCSARFVACGITPSVSIMTFVLVVVHNIVFFNGSMISTYILLLLTV